MWKGEYRRWGAAYKQQRGITGKLDIIMEERKRMKEERGSDKGRRETGMCAGKTGAGWEVLGRLGTVEGTGQKRSKGRPDRLMGCGLDRKTYNH